MLGEKLTLRACVALLKYETDAASSKATSTLIEDRAKTIFAVIQLVKPVAKEVVKPVRVQIPHSLFNAEEEDSICLFCRSEDKVAMELFLGSTAGGIAGLTKVLSIDDVKKYYNQYKDKKQLLKSHTHFVCDTRVVRQLYNRLGKDFSSRNNYPVPVDMQRSDKVAAGVDKAVKSTYMHLSGSNITIRLGNTGMSAKAVAANLVEGTAFAVDKVTGKWDNVGGVSIKTKDSAALPIYSKVENAILAFVSSAADGDISKRGNVATSAFATINASSNKKSGTKGTPTASVIGKKRKGKAVTKQESGKSVMTEEEVVVPTKRVKTVPTAAMATKAASSCTTNTKRVSRSR